MVRKYVNIGKVIKDCKYMHFLYIFSLSISLINVNTLKKDASLRHVSA